MVKQTDIRTQKIKIIKDILKEDTSLIFNDFVGLMDVVSSRFDVSRRLAREYLRIAIHELKSEGVIK
jgi:hypothetical protein